MAKKQEKSKTDLLQEEIQSIEKGELETLLQHGTAGVLVRHKTTGLWGSSLLLESQQANLVAALERLRDRLKYRWN